MVQAPIFHGYAFSLHVEMENPVEIEGISKALTGEHVSITGMAEESPSNVNAAGQAMFWFRSSPTRTAQRVVAVGLRGQPAYRGNHAVECAENMAASRPKGKIQ